MSYIKLFLLASNRSITIRKVVYNTFNVNMVHIMLRRKGNKTKQANIYIINPSS